jgi:hypothetical protein
MHSCTHATTCAHIGTHMRALTCPRVHPSAPQVEGLASSCSDAAIPQLAAVGAAACWRMGRWDMLRGYVGAVERGGGRLDQGQRWEVRGPGA